MRTRGYHERRWLVTEIDGQTANERDTGTFRFDLSMSFAVAAVRCGEPCVHNLRVYKIQGCMHTFVEHFLERKPELCRLR